MDELLIPVFVLVSLALPFLALALLFYAVPVRASVRLVLRQGFREQALVIAWGIFGIRSSRTEAVTVTGILVMDSTILSRTEPVKSGGIEKAAEQPAGQATAPGAGDVARRILAVLGPAGSFGAAVWRECRFEEARGRVTIGLGDPVLTGECCGLYWASRFLLEASRIYLELEPVFDRPVLELDITAKMNVRHPISILIAGLRLARDPAFRGAPGVPGLQPGGVPAP
jgi:Protein of unknown function (DUF2953)